jgi:hypothetical protein
VRCHSHVACALLRGMSAKSVATALLCGRACERKMCVKFDFANSDTHTVITTTAQDRHTHTHTLSLSLTSSLHRHPHAIKLSSHIVLHAHSFCCVESVSLLVATQTHATHSLRCSGSDPLGCDPSVVDTGDGHTLQPTLSYASTYIRVRVSVDCMRVLARRAPLCACVSWLPKQKQRHDIAAATTSVGLRSP